MKTSDIMTFGTATVRDSDTLLRAIELLIDHRISALPVLDENGKPAGILTEGDLLHYSGFHLAQVLAKPLAARRVELERWQVRELMTHDCETVGLETPLEVAIQLMDFHGWKRLPVLADGKLVGILSRSDLLRALVKDG